MLSRPIALKHLKSLGDLQKTKAIIEGGPPELYVDGFKKLFGNKIQKTKARAAAAAEHYQFFPGKIGASLLLQTRTRGWIHIARVLTGSVGAPTHLFRSSSTSIFYFVLMVLLRDVHGKARTIGVSLETL